MRSAPENRMLRSPGSASFNSASVNRFSEARGRRAEVGENAEVVDDVSGSAAEVDTNFNAGYEAKAASSLGNVNQNRRSFVGAWKPVIDGKIQIPEESPASNSWPKRRQQRQQQGSERPSVSNVSGSSDIKKDDEGNDSDSEIRRVPELPEKTKIRPHKTGGSSSSKKRPGASSNDKEGKRIKRLLRNRVSAQQARERKKAYLIELEHKAKELETRNAELEEKNGTLQRENYMLRQIVKNTTMRGGTDAAAANT